MDHSNGLGADRLATLADHLLSGELLHDKFNYSTYHSESSCGSAGCALGECAAIWKEWQVNRHGMIWLEGDDDSAVDACEAAHDWFGLSYAEVAELFYPADPRCPLDRDATRYDVARHIMAFLGRKGWRK